MTEEAPPPELTRLDERVIPYERLMRTVRAVIVAAVLGVLALIAFSDDWLTPTLRLVLLGLAILGVVVDAACIPWVPPLVHRHFGYRVNEQGLEIRSGIWWRSVVTVARSRIQHLDVTQGPMERRFGLARLHVHTAGTEDGSVVLHGLAHATARALREDLGAWATDADGV